MFHTFIYQPLYNILIFLYNVIPGGDFGVAIIVTTLLIKFALYPLSQKQIESQKKLQEMQPKIKELQTKHKDNKEQQSKALMEFYKTHKTNPLSGCLPLVVQLFFLVAIYRVLLNISTNEFVVDQSALYSFVANPGTINGTLFGFIELSKPFWPFAVLAAAAQFVQTKMLMAKKDSEKSAETKKKDEEPDFGKIMSTQMMYLGPALTFFIGIKFYAGLSLYWVVSTVFAIAQQSMIQKKSTKPKL
ncbi:YidC/Oxa1 family membrane protein insertase [Patescibacteria group bacterium]|nr:MAG: YidC/Oxa1 family membrane protein insertase [Patescibacteria group bacterium]